MLLPKDLIASVPSPSAYAALLFLCVFAIGWGPSDYVIHVYGDYYVWRGGGNVFSLVRKLPPVDGNDKSPRFKDIYEGIHSYGHSRAIIYGTTSRGDGFLLNPPAPIRVFSDRDKWVDALEALGVHEVDLKIPQPPEEESLIPPAVWWLSVGVLFTIALTIFVWRLWRKNNRDTHELGGTV